MGQDGLTVYGDGDGRHFKGKENFICQVIEGLAEDGRYEREMCMRNEERTSRKRSL